MNSCCVTEKNESHIRFAGMYLIMHGICRNSTLDCYFYHDLILVLTSCQITRTCMVKPKLGVRDDMIKRAKKKEKAYSFLNHSTCYCASIHTSKTLMNVGINANINNYKFRPHFCYDEDEILRAFHFQTHSTYTIYGTTYHNLSMIHTNTKKRSGIHPSTKYEINRIS